MSPRNLLILIVLCLPVLLGWWVSRTPPRPETIAANPVNRSVAKDWNGPGFLEFLPDSSARFLASYCAQVRIGDSMAGIAAARLPFLHERALTKLHAAADSTISFGYCQDDFLTVPWKTLHGRLSGEPGAWRLRFWIVDNLIPTDTSSSYFATGRTLGELDNSIDKATERIGRDMAKMAVRKRGTPPAWSEFFVDSRDSLRYPVATVGGQRWLARNLAYRTKNAHCPEGTDSCPQGFFYPYEDALDACPVGWTLPSDAQWRRLAQNLPHLELSAIPTRENLPYVARDDSDFAPVMRGIGTKTGKRLGSQAWWWSSGTCKDDNSCRPVHKKYIVHLLDEMSIAWGVHWNPHDSLRSDGWSRMLGWQQLGLSVRCVEEKSL